MQGKKVKDFFFSSSTVKRWTVCVKVLAPAVEALRYSDGKKGGAMGLVYDLLLQLNELYSKEIKGLDENIRKKVCAAVIPRVHPFNFALKCCDLYPMIPVRNET